MYIKFKTWDDEDVQIPIEDVKHIKPNDFLTAYVETKKGGLYHVFNHITFTKDK